SAAAGRVACCLHTDPDRRPRLCKWLWPFTFSARGQGIVGAVPGNCQTSHRCGADHADNRAWRHIVHCDKLKFPPDWITFPDAVMMPAFRTLLSFRRLQRSLMAVGLLL